MNMRSLALLSVLGVCLIVTGCGPSEAEVKAENARKEKEVETAKIEALKTKVADGLSDPLSAQFRQLKYLADSNSLCGEINAKNSLGGYAGFKKFGVSVDGDAVILNRINFEMAALSDDELNDQIVKLHVAMGLREVDINYISDQVYRKSFKYWEKCA
jgi:hypothetical protein